MDKVSGIGHHFMKLSINAEDLQDLNLTSLDMTKNLTTSQDQGTK
jgi:hypothetical protein